MAKLLTTAFGEASSDFVFFDDHLGMPLYASTLLLLGIQAAVFTADTLGLGTLASALVFLAVILVPAAGYRWARLGEVPASWFACTITRPLGASVADRLAVPAPCGDGLQIGTGPISLVAGLVLVPVVAAIDHRHRRADVHEDVAVPSGSRG